MGLVAWFWDTLVWDVPEETDALELTLAELDRGSTLPEALDYASRSIGGLVASRGMHSAQRRFGRRLDSMARGTTPRREPWRTLHAAWEAFPAGRALADQGFGLVTKLRGQRALRVQCARAWAGIVLAFLALAGGCLAIAAWEAALAPVMTMSYRPSRLTPVRDWAMSFGAPALVLVATGAVMAALYSWTRRWLIPSALGGSASELLFFIGTGLSSGAPLPEVLRRAAEKCPGIPDEEKSFLKSLAASIESDSTEPDARDVPAWRLLLHAARQWRAGVLTTESLRFSALVLADRSRERFGGLVGMSFWTGVGVLMLAAGPICATLLGGPIGHWFVYCLLGNAEMGSLPSLR